MRHGDREFEVRAAIETGQAVVSLASGPQIGENVAGDVVNTASRLQSAAPPGGVVVGESAHGLTEHAIGYRALEAVSGKGEGRPLPGWEGTGGPAPPRTPARPRAG